MSLYSNTLSRFRANQPLLFVNAACLTEKQQIQFYSLWFDPTELEYVIYHTRGEHANHYTTNVYHTRGEHANHYTTNVYHTLGEHANHYTTDVYHTRGEHANHYTTDVVSI